MDIPKLILASASPRRLELLGRMGIDFHVVVGRIDEIAGEHLSPHEIVRVNAYRKARAVSKKYADYLVIGADTTVCLGHRVLGKPTDLAVAERMLEELQGRTHEVVTAVCLVHLREHRQKVFAESTSVTFQPLTREAIRRYLSLIDPLDKAGAYAIQEKGDMIIEEYSGSFSNVVGLPLERLQVELEAW
ncbi:MAG: Maf family protein [Verrucomicrobiota bacterium]